MRPYDLRHSFVSLLIAEGANVVEIARQAGHSPTITLSTYAHLFDERPPGRASAEDEIRAARQALRYPRRTRFVPENQLELFPDLEESPANPRKPTRGFEPRTPSLRAMISCRERSRLVAQSRMNPGILRNLGGGRGPQMTRA